MNTSKKGLTKAMRSGHSIMRAESREPRAESREPRAEHVSPPRARANRCRASRSDLLPPRRGSKPHSTAAVPAAGVSPYFGALARSARAVAVACLCAGAFAPAAAQAQTTNFYLWRTTMTVGGADDHLGYHKDNGWGELSTGRTFNHPPWSPPHKHHVDPNHQFEIDGIYITDAGRLVVEADLAQIISSLPGKLTFWIRTTGFVVPGGAGGTFAFGSINTSEMPDLDWEEDEEVRVALVYERTLPSAPTNVRVTAPPGEEGTLEVSWDEADDGTFPIECYLVEFRHPSGEARDRKQSYPGSLGTGEGCGDSPPTSVRRTDLETGVQYQVLVQALSGDGFSEWSETKTVRANGRTPRSDLTAEFVGMPRKHDGERAFRFRVAFSENIGISYRSLREDAFTVTGGRVVGGKRVDDRRDLFRMTVEPDGDGDVTITLPEGRKCGVSGAICTKGKNRRRLTNTPSATVRGPASGMDFAHFAKGATIASEMVLVNAAPPSEPSRYLFLRHQGRSDPRRIGSGLDGRSGSHGGRCSDGPDGDGAAGRTHDFDPRAGRAGVGIGDGAL